MKIKECPEDFIVEEIAAYTLSENGDREHRDNYGIYRLEKNGLNTEEAVERICTMLRISRKNVNYAGTKDRNATTTQYVSIFHGKKEWNVEHTYEGNRRFALSWIGYADEPLSLGTLKGNQFRIIIRDISDEEKVRFEQHIHLATTNAHNSSNDLNNQGFMFPNYFDEQRFSTYNFDIGLCILKKDFQKAAELVVQSGGHAGEKVRECLAQQPNAFVYALTFVPKKILTMYIHAVQSFIFNESLARTLKECALQETKSEPKSASYTSASFHTIDMSYYTIPYSRGTFVFYENTHAVESVESYARYTRLGIDAIAIVGFDAQTLDKHTQDIMRELALTPRSFIIREIPELTAEGTMRNAFASAENVSYTYIDAKTIELQFSLPKGSYATIVVKALFG